jgi:hypothetical protein
MDAAQEVGRAKWLILAALVFLVSGCVSWGEFAYLLTGKTADAKITKVAEVTKRGRFGISTGTQLEVSYEFTEADGTRRTASDTADVNWPVPPSGKTPVQYTPGADGNSRLAGKVNWIALSIFGVALVAVGWFTFRLIRRASAEVNDTKPKRK